MRDDTYNTSDTIVSLPARVEVSAAPKTLIICDFAGNPALDDENIIYRPELGIMPENTTILQDIISTTKPEIIVVKDGQEVPAAVMNTWQATMAQCGKTLENLHIVTRGRPMSKVSATEEKEFGVTSSEVHSSDSELEKDQAALMDIATIVIEKIYSNTLLSVAKSPLPATQKLRSVALVGAGIESLVTGLILLSKGYDVTFIEGADDFRNKDIFDQKSTSTLSVKSHGRHLSAEESIPFNLKRKQDYPFNYTSEEGWLSKRKEDLLPEENEWQAAFHKIAIEQPAFFVHATKLTIAMNKLGMQQWQVLLDSPEVVKDTSIVTPMYRIFSNLPSVPKQHYYQIETETNQKRKNNGNFELLSPKDVDKLFPGIHYVHSAIRVEGASVDITQLVHNLVTILENKGANFKWRTKAKNLLYNQEGLVAGLHVENKVGKQMFVQADDYVVSTGNAGNQLLSGTASHNKVQGLAGLWATLPNVYGITQSFKVMASEQLCVSNITVSADGKQLYVSGGHGYIGLDRDLDLEKGEGAVLKQRFLGYLRDMYPDAYVIAEKEGTLDVKSCIRPSTADGLPLFESMSAENGKLIMNLGHNCGGFIVAPVMGWVIEQALQGKSNILQKVLESTRPSINTPKTL